MTDAFRPDDAARVPPRRPCVLVVDDEDLVRLVLAHKLRLAGFDVVEARDGLEAQAAMAGVDLVLTDLNMPRCNGEQLCRDLRAAAATAAIPVVLMTGGPIDEDRMRDAGCDSVIYKPLPDTLADLLRTVLRQARAHGHAGGTSPQATDRAARHSAA